MRIPEIDWLEIEWRDPIDAYAPFAGEPYACLMIGDQNGWGAVFDPIGGPWAFIVADPAHTIESLNGRAIVDGIAQNVGGFEALRQFHLERRGQCDGGAGPIDRSPLTSGLVGFCGYEMGAELEPTAEGPRSPFALPDMAFGVYDAVACFNISARRAFIAARQPRAGAALAERLGQARSDIPRFRTREIRASRSASAYAAMVQDVRERILSGELFQANISHRLSATAPLESKPIAILAALAAEGIAPFSGLFQYGAGAIVSASPERFAAIDAGGAIVAEPIKGTRPRGGNEESDAALAAALADDPKDRAENIMIVDLLRNDLSRICLDGSIAEDFICRVVTQPTVHHLVSRISGRLRPEIDSVSALSALFPYGSITGAPKVQAMRTIGDIECEGRGPYCGAIGYLDDRGNAEFCVAIRVAIIDMENRQRRISIPVGGGVTLRSDPMAEYQETLVKAARLLRTIDQSGDAPTALHP